MNPLDLPGPQFLAFYAALAIIVLLVLYVARSMGEANQTPTMRFEDPYLIAYLRGGKNEALRVSTVSLVDRGILKWEGLTTLSATPNEPARPIEQALVRHFAQPASATSIFTGAILAAATDEYRTKLTRLKLLPSDTQVSARRRRLALALVVLIGVSAAKVWVALSHGRTNIAFLIILTVVACMLASKSYNPHRTPAGDALLADLRMLFARLKERAHTLRPGGETSEVALLMAVFGVRALSPVLFPYARQLFPKSTASPSSSSCGSACGSSCGGGGGGGCGGCGGGGGD